MPWILAIDPGKTGGLVVRYKEDEKPLHAQTMPQKGEPAIAEWFREMGQVPGLKAIYLERVWGREGDSKRSITTFMSHLGFLRGCAYSSLILPAESPPRLVEVPPTKWQNSLDCPKAPSKEQEPKAHRRKTIHKNDLNDMAQEMFPDQKVTLRTADALLISEYAYRDLGW